MYDDPVAPATSTHPAPAASHRRHCRANDNGDDPDHDPSDPDNTPPTPADPDTTGNAEFDGGAAATTAVAADVAELPFTEAS